MIEPQRRRYDAGEEARLLELFGETPRWGDSLRPFLWTHVGATVAGFTGVTEVDLPVTCTYDFEVAGAKYLHSLDDGEIPLLLLFSGTVFSKGPAGVQRRAGRVARGGPLRLPVARLARADGPVLPRQRLDPPQPDTLDALQRFKAARALPDVGRRRSSAC